MAEIENEEVEVDESALVLVRMVIDEIVGALKANSMQQTEEMAKRFAAMIQAMPKPEKMPEFKMPAIKFPDIKDRPKCLESKVEIEKDWRGVITGLTFKHKYEGDEED